MEVNISSCVIANVSRYYLVGIPTLITIFFFCLDLVIVHLAINKMVICIFMLPPPQWEPNNSKINIYTIDFDRDKRGGVMRG